MRTACWIALVVAVVAVVGCKKEGASPGAPASSGEVDALWKLAPEGVTLGIVLSPRAMTLGEHAYTEIGKFLDATPELAADMKEMHAELTQKIGAADFSWQAIGVSTQKGAAMFMLPSKKAVTLFSVADKAKFDKLIHEGKKGQDLVCKDIQGMYACSDDPTALERIGKGSLSAAAANARGDIEVAGKDLPMDRGQTASFAAVVQLAPGAVTLRGAFTGLPAKALGMLGPATAPRTEGDKTTGFALAHVSELLKLMPPLPGELGELAKTIEDPITMVTTSTAVDLHIPLNDAKPATQALIEHCTSGPMAMLGAKLVAGTCEFTVPNIPGMTLDIWVDGKTLRIGQKGAAAPASVEPTELGKELAKTEWQVAFYGRGSLLANYPGTQMPEMPADLAGVMHAALRAMVMLDEVGLAIKVDGSALRFVFGVRTAWSNSDAVVAKLLALDPEQLVAGKGGDLAKPILAAAPDSILAKDVKAGYMGLMIPSAGIGMLAAVAIPAFLEYQKRGRTTQVALDLNRLGKSLKIYYIENAEFPVGDAPLTPDKPCCGQPANKCAVDPSMFTGIWQKLDFTIDQPSMYRYRYHSDGKTVEIEAVSDADCDGKEATTTLEVAAPNGNPTTAIVPPPAGVY